MNTNTSDQPEHSVSDTVGLDRILRTFKGWHWIIVVIVIGMCAMALYAITKERDYTVVIIVPNEFLGVITLQEDKDRGIEPAMQGSDTYVYTIPESGTLLVKNFEPFEQWHRTIARYANGREIPTWSSELSRRYVIGPDTIVLREVGARVKGQDNPEHIIFVGNLHDFQRMQSAW
jgi:hypothetical protein